MITVREFNFGEENLVADIYNKTFLGWRDKFGDKLGNAFGYKSSSPHEVLEWTKEPKVHLLVAEYDGRLVGFAHLKLKEAEGVPPGAG